MTSRSRKKRPTTPPSTTARRAPDQATPARAGQAAATYRDVAVATAAAPAEPLWLPSAWLVVVLLLTSAAPTIGAGASSDGWRSRSKPAAAKTRTVTGYRWDRALRPVAYEDDIAGPALRVAQRERPDTESIRREYRLAQDPIDRGSRDELLEAMEEPLGVDPEASQGAPFERGESDYPLPADPLDDEPGDEPSPPSNDEFDFARSPAEEDDDVADDLAAPLGLGDTIDRGDDIDGALAEEQEAASKDCAEELARLKANRLYSVDLSIGIDGVAGQDYPFECSIDDGSVGAPRCWGEITYMWKASALCHKPLYFEDVHLERYGHSWGPFVQPFVSGAHFFGRLPVLPYCMGLKAPNECVYTLGHYRPGSCAPYTIDAIPFTWRAALFQAGGAVGVAAFLP